MQLSYNKKKKCWNLFLKCWKAKIMSTEPKKRAHSRKNNLYFQGILLFFFCHGKVHWSELISRCQMMIELVSVPLFSYQIQTTCVCIYETVSVNMWMNTVYTCVHMGACLCVCVLALPLLRVAELFMSAVMKDDSDCFLTVSFHILRIRLWQQRKRGGSIFRFWTKKFCNVSVIV